MFSVFTHRSNVNPNLYLLGSNFDLQKLMQSKSAYSIDDGDIPCTPEKEPTYG